MFWQEPYIPPCCDQKFFPQLIRDSEWTAAHPTSDDTPEHIATALMGTDQVIYPNTDYDIVKLLTILLPRYKGAELTIVLNEPLHHHLATAVRGWLNKSWSLLDADGKRIPYFRSVHICVPEPPNKEDDTLDMSNTQDIIEWFKDSQRIKVSYTHIAHTTAIILRKPDFSGIAFTGYIRQQYTVSEGTHPSFLSVTTRDGLLNEIATVVRLNINRKISILDHA